jgi:hypothetical protein
MYSGKHIRLPGETRWREIVGVAKNANYTSWGEPSQLCVYVPLDQNYSDAMTLYVRNQGDPQQILRSVQREIHDAEPQILSTDMRTGREIIDGGLFQAKMGVVLLSLSGSWRLRSRASDCTGLWRIPCSKDNEKLACAWL